MNESTSKPDLVANPYQAPRTQPLPTTVHLRLGCVGYFLGFLAGGVLAVVLIGRYTKPSDWGLGHEVTIRAGAAILIAGGLGTVLFWCIGRWVMGYGSPSSKSGLTADDSSAQL